MRCACTSIPHALAVVCTVACSRVLLAFWCFGIFGHFIAVSRTLFFLLEFIFSVGVFGHFLVSIYSALVSHNRGDWAVADPNLQIRGGDPGHPDPEIRGRGAFAKIFFLFGLKIRGSPPLDLLLLSRFIAFPTSPLFIHISTDLLSVASACFLPLHTGAHDWVTRIFQPWEGSPSRSWLPRERRSVTSYYHGSKISGSQPKGALAMTTATATKTAKKNTSRFILAKQQLWTGIMIDIWYISL